MNLIKRIIPALVALPFYLLSMDAAALPNSSSGKVATPVEKRMAGHKRNKIIEYLIRVIKQDMNLTSGGKCTPWPDCTFQIINDENKG